MGKKKTIIVLIALGDGSQGRSFCYVSDLIEGIVRMAGLPENPGVPVNLGNPVEYSVGQLAQKVLEKATSTWPLPLMGNIVYQPLPVDDPTQRCPDITRANRILGGWEPKVELDEGLERTIDWFRDHV